MKLSLISFAFFFFFSILFLDFSLCSPVSSSSPSFSVHSSLLRLLPSLNFLPPSTSCSYLTHDYSGLNTHFDLVNLNDPLESYYFHACNSFVNSTNPCKSEFPQSAFCSVSSANGNVNLADWTGNNVYDNVHWAYLNQSNPKSGIQFTIANQPCASFPGSNFSVNAQFHCSLTQSRTFGLSSQLCTYTLVTQSPYACSVPPPPAGVDRLTLNQPEVKQTKSNELNYFVLEGYKIPQPTKDPELTFTVQYNSTGDSIEFSSSPVLSLYSSLDPFPDKLNSSSASSSPTSSLSLSLQFDHQFNYYLTVEISVDAKYSVLASLNQGMKEEIEES